MPETDKPFSIHAQKDRPMNRKRKLILGAALPALIVALGIVPMIVKRNSEIRFERRTCTD
jgi:hypothetical protein